METYGLIGFPLKHSFSARFFSEKFARENIDAEYLNFEIEDIMELRRVTSQSLTEGAQRHYPHKEQVIPFLHTLSPEAEEIAKPERNQVVRQPAKCITIISLATIPITLVSESHFVHCSGMKFIQMLLFLALGCFQSCWPSTKGSADHSPICLTYTCGGTLQLR